MTVKADAHAADGGDPPPAGSAPAADVFPEAALSLLRRLTGPHGIQASAAHGATAEYHAVFTRDAVMAGIAGLLAADATIAEGLGRSLDTLRANLGAEGQVPSNVRLLTSGKAHVSFGSLAPRLDGAAWFLVGAGLAVRNGVRAAAELAVAVRRVARLLDALEYNGQHLLYLPAGGNWADEYVTDGWTLSDQVLRAWGLRICAEAFAEPGWAAKADAIGAAVAERFRDDAAEGPGPHWPLATVGPTGVRRVLDLAGCALLGVSGTAGPLADEALDAITARFLAAGRLPAAFHPVIHEGDAEWPALRRYHLHAFRNVPHEYHNGGIWPLWLGWLALALAARQRTGALATLRALAAHALAVPGFAHHEFLHGETLAPLGNTDMAYTATGLVMLAAAGTPAQRRILG